MLRTSAKFSAILCATLFITRANANLVVYTNDFQTNTAGTTAGGVTTTGFTDAGTLAPYPLTTVNLNLNPTTGGPNQASLNTTTKWLGITNTNGSPVGLGQGVNKSVNPDANTGGNNPNPGFNTTSAGNNEVVNLSLSGLQTGQTYSVQFDLLIGASWDGAAGGYAPDYWYFSANNNLLVNTIFANTNNGSFGDSTSNVGAYSPQRYTDSSYTTPGPASSGGFGQYSAASNNLPYSGDVDHFTGADAYNNTEFNNGYSDLYAVYDFGHGAGNPTLTFTATSPTESLEWGRYSGSSDSSDEYWALDNVNVTALPEPGPASLLLLATLLLIPSRKAAQLIKRS